MVTSALAPAEVLEELDGLSSEDRETLREEAKFNLYFLCKGVLGYKDVTLRVHGPATRFIQQSEKLRRLLLMPRGHLKSTMQLGDAIRLALCDPEDTRVLFISETATLAEKLLEETKGHFERNEILRSLFPELILDRFSGPGIIWRNDKARLPRKSPWKEGTWEALGVGGSRAGAHYTRIKADDLIGFEAMRSAAAMATVIAWVDTIEPFLVTPSEDTIDWTGTRWSRNDVYAHLMRGYGLTLAVHTRSAVEQGEIIFPEKYDWTVYERIQRINPALWAAQYENNPLTSLSTDFPIESLRSFQFSHDGEAIRLQSGKEWDLDQLDRCLTADPNSGSLAAPDAAAINVQGVSPDDEVATLDSWSGRVSPSDFVDQIYNLARRWRVRVVGIEKAGQQNTDHYFKLKAERENYSVRVEELRPRGRAKVERCRAALQPLIRSGLLHVLPSQTVLRQQIAEFPDCILWDEVDALSYGPEIWHKPEQTEVIQRRTSVVKKLLALRHPRTGY